MNASDELGHLAPRETFDPTAAVDAMRRAISAAGALDLFERMQAAYDVRRCLWAGQSRDGRRYAKNQGQTVAFNGSSDARIRRADQTIRENVRVMKQATRHAELTVLPQNIAAEDGRHVRAEIWGHVADYYRRKSARVTNRQIELLANFREEFGYGLMYIGWKDKQQVEERTIDRISAVQGALALDMEENPEADPTATAQALADLFSTPDPELRTVPYLQRVDPEMSESEARRIARQLWKGDPVKYHAVTPRGLGYEMRALAPWVDVFFPVETETMETTPWVGWVEWVSKVELEARIAAEGYDKDWVESVVAQPAGRLPAALMTGVNKAPGWLLSGLSVGLGTETPDANTWPIIHFYHRAIAVAGAPAIYRTILHPDITDAVAHHGLCPNANGELPFIDVRRDVSERLLVSSQGVPELAATDQNEMKLQRDATADRTTWAAKPPLKVPAAYAGGRIRVEPGVQIPVARAGSTDVLTWMAPPPFDPGFIEIQKQLDRSHDFYWGRGADQLPEVRRAFWQEMVDDWLADIAEAMRHAFQLIQQFTPDIVIANVAGVTEPMSVTRADIQGAFDVRMQFDAGDLDAELTVKRIETFGKLVAPMDNQAVLDRAEMVKLAVRALAPKWANRLVRPPEVAMQHEMDDEDNALSKLRAGIEVPFQTGGNHRARLQRLQDNVAKSPSLQLAVQGDPTFAALLQARMKMHEQQLVQEQNAITGATGAKPVLG